MKNYSIIRFDLSLGHFYYCYDQKLGPFLSKSPALAFNFDSTNSIYLQADRIIKYFFCTPVKYTILSYT